MTDEDISEKAEPSKRWYGDYVGAIGATIGVCGAMISVFSFVANSYLAAAEARLNAKITALSTVVEANHKDVCGALKNSGKLTILQMKDNLADIRRAVSSIRLNTDDPIVISELKDLETAEQTLSNWAAAVKFQDGGIVECPDR